MPLRYLYRTLAVLTGVCLLLFGFYYIYFYYQDKPQAGIQLPALTVKYNEVRMLVVAPHCDDETLGCAGLIHDVMAAGGQVMVVVMTNGDGFTFAAEEQFRRLFLTNEDYINSGYSRQRETTRALRWLGVNENQIIFLGYPDRGLSAIWAEHWDNSWPYQSRYTGSSYSPYSNSYQPQAPYAGEAVLANLVSIIEDFRPTLIVAPHPADEHPDHAATWAFVAAALAQQTTSGLASHPALYTYLVHRGDFPIPHGYKKEALLLPPKPLFQGTVDNWSSYALTAENEAVKEHALKEYVSQLRVPIMSSLLYSFIRRNELFAQANFPVAAQAAAEEDLSKLEAWQHKTALLVNPLGVNVLGALEHRAKISAIAGVIQNNALWLYVHIPEFGKKHNQYYLSVVEFYQQPTGLKRGKKTLYFSTDDTTIPPENIMRYQDDVIIRIPYSSQPLPDYFFLQAVTKDKIGATINHTVWQPVLTPNFAARFSP